MEILFLKLLNMSISASWLVLAVLLLRLVLYRAPKWIRGILWALVALRLVCPFSIESALSMVPSAEPVPPDILYAAHPRLDTGIPALNTASAPVMESVFAPQPGNSVDPLQVWLYLGAWLWLAGAAVMLLYAIASYLRLRRRVAASIVLQDNVWLCDDIGSPFILGVFAPRVYVPSSLVEPQLSHVLAHERAHLDRHDHWWKPLGFLLLAAYWFDPVLWIAYVFLCRDIELACDERVYRDMALNERADYSQTLLDLSKSRYRVAACPLAFGESGVKERVKAALHYKKPAFWVVALSLFACAAAAVCFLTDPEEKADVPAEEGPAPVRLGIDHFGEASVWEEEQTLTLPELPGVTVTYTSDAIRIEGTRDGKKMTFDIPGMPVWNIFFADLTGDGKPEICATVSFGSGIVDEHIVVFETVSWKCYELWDRGKYDYVLSGSDGDLIVDRYGYDHAGRSMPEAVGTLAIRGDLLVFVPAQVEDATERFTNLMGFDGYFGSSKVSGYHLQHSYYAIINGRSLPIAESFGFERDDHMVDLDGDGMTELVCNCVYGGDGARRVYVYRRNGSQIERGSIDYDRSKLTAWDNWGANSTAEWYDPESGKIMVEYASLASSTMSRTFICEAGYDALVWEAYAQIPQVAALETHPGMIEYGSLFADDGQISDRAKNSVYFMSGSGILNGVGGPDGG